VDRAASKTYIRWSKTGGVMVALTGGKTDNVKKKKKPIKKKSKGGQEGRKKGGERMSGNGDGGVET